MSDERTPVGSWIAALLIGLPVLYPLSSGPACWRVSHGTVSSKAAWRGVRPVACVGVHGPEWAKATITSYAGLWYARSPDALGTRTWATPFEYEQLITAARRNAP